MPWLPGLIQSDHDIQNPTTAEKVRTVARRLRLGPGDHVLAVGSGRGGPSVAIATETGCRVTAVEQHPPFVAAARERAAAAGVGHLVEAVEGDAAEHPRPGETYAAVFSLGTSFVHGGYEPALRRAAAGVRPGGHVVVGEPYARVAGQRLGGEELPTLAALLAVLPAAGLRPVTVVTASEDDWDTYHSLNLLALENWLDAHGDDPDAAEVAAFRSDCVAHYLAEREAGWAMIAARVP